MQTTTCAYCDHEVKITPNGVCLFCGGNLAEEPFEETDDNGKTRLQRIRDLLGIYPDPLPNKSYHELYKMYMGKSGTEINLQTTRRKLEKETRLQSIRKMLEKEEQKRRESQAKKEMKELDTLTKIVSKSETVKDLVKSLDKPLIPFWLKFGGFIIGGFIIGLIVSMPFSFPRVQEAFIKILISINNSPISILFMSIVPILFALIAIRKFDRI